MFYLRAVRNHTPFTPDSFDLESAVKGLTEAGPISVYEVDGEPLGDRIATLFAMRAKPQPEHVSYVLIPDVLLPPLNLTVRATPSDIDHDLMHQMHRELDGLTSVDIRRQLAVAIRDNAAAIRKRLHPKVTDLGRKAKAEVNDPNCSQQALALVAGKVKWLELIRNS